MKIGGDRAGEGRYLNVQAFPKACTLLQQVDAGGLAADAIDALHEKAHETVDLLGLVFVDRVQQGGQVVEVIRYSGAGGLASGDGLQLRGDSAR